MQPLEAGRCVLILFVGLALGACSSLDFGKKVDYKSATQLPPLDVPPDLTRPGADDRYRVPETNPLGTTTYSDYNRERSSVRAGGSAVLPESQNVRVARDGNQRWLVVKGAPEQLWPVVKDFWQESGYIVNVDMPDSGIMETDWAESRARVDAGTIRNFLSKMLDFVYSSAERDKFRTRFERGSEPGTTEIFVSHRGMMEVFVSHPSADKVDTAWQPRPSDPTVEAEMLGRLMVRLGVDSTSAKSQVAAVPAVAPRATLLKGGDGASTLTLNNEQFDRAWRRVGLALDRVGFTVEDRDRSKGLYFVRYRDPEVDNKGAEKSLLSKLKFWGDGDKPKIDQFRIQVRDVEATGSRVNVLSKDGNQESSETAGKILSLLYEQLK